MFAVERRWRTIRIDIFQLAMPPDIALLLHVNFVSRAAKNDHPLNGCLAAQRVIGVFLQWHNSTAPICAIRGDQSDGAAVSDPVAKAIRAKSPKNHRMHCADAGAGQHAYGGSGVVRETNTDPVALHGLGPAEH